MDLEMKWNGWRSPFYLLIVVIVLSLVGCLAEDDQGNGNNTAGDGTAAVYFPDDVAAVFSGNCTSCHGTGETEAGMSLESDQYSAVVDQPSTQKSAVLRIDSANGSSQSYIYLKITGDSSISGSPMPPPAGGLTQTDRDTIGTWIDAGATPKP